MNIESSCSREVRDLDHFSSLLQIDLSDTSLEFVLQPARSVLNPEARVTVYDQDEESQLDAPATDCVFTGYSKTDLYNTAIISRCTGTV